LAAIGVDADTVGPGIVDVNHMVVRQTDEAFIGCVICSVEVHNVDFIDVRRGVIQAYYWVPVWPGCFAFSGRGVVYPPFPTTFELADASGNYWGPSSGPSSGPSTTVNLLDVGLQISHWDDTVNALREGLDDAGLSLLEDASAHLASHYFGPEVTVGDGASVNVGVNSCTIPVPGVPPYPAIVNPVLTDDHRSFPIHEIATAGGGDGGW
jgi:hypothetical protein